MALCSCINGVACIDCLGDCRIPRFHVSDNVPLACSYFDCDFEYFGIIPSNVFVDGVFRCHNLQTIIQTNNQRRMVAFVDERHSQSFPLCGNVVAFDYLFHPPRINVVGFSIHYDDRTFLRGVCLANTHDENVCIVPPCQNKRNEVKKYFKQAQSCDLSQLFD